MTPIIDRGVIFDAARHALTLHQWLAAPDFDAEGEVQRAEQHLAGCMAPNDTPMLAAAHGLHAWLESGGARAPIRAALIRFWVHHRILRMPIPLTGAVALRAETPFELSAWQPVFLHALAAEATDGRQQLMDLERAWFEGRAAVAGRRRDSHVAGRRRDSHAAAAVDLLAAVPLLSATTLAKGLGLAVKNAIRLLDGLVAAGVAVEVTHRSKRRLFGLKGMAPLAAAVRPPYRPEPGRGRGRPPLIVEEPAPPPEPLPPLSPIEQRAFDYSDLEQSMAQLDLVLRETRRSLDVVMGRAPAVTQSTWSRVEEGEIDE